MSLPAHVSQDAMEATLEAGAWELGMVTFASGAQANNKLYMERILSDPQRCDRLLVPMGQLIMRAEPDALWGPPTGGQHYAIEQGARLDLPVIHLVKLRNEPGIKTYDYETTRDRQLAEEAQTLACVEDATTELTSIDGGMSLPPLGAKTLLVVGAWRRGTQQRERRIGADITWVIEQPLPDKIKKSHPFYKKYGHLAVGKLPK